MAGSEFQRSTSRVSRSTTTRTTAASESFQSFQSTRIEGANVDTAKEAEDALRNFKEHRQNDDAARKGMLDEVERVMKLIRDLRRVTEFWSVRRQTEMAKGDELRTKVELVSETIRSILTRFPDRYVPSGDGKGDLDRLEIAVTRLVEGVSEAEEELSKTKRQVAELSKDMRAEAEELQRMLDEAAYRLRYLVGDTDGKMSLLELIKAGRKLLDEEKKASSDTTKKLREEKKKMDEMLDRRRDLLTVLHQLYERCDEVDQLMKELGLQSTTPCPKKVDEKKQMAVEFERALSWLISQISAIIGELRAAKRRLSEGEDKLKRSERNSKEIADQMAKCQETVQKLAAKLDDLKAKLNEAAQRNAQAQKTANDLQKAYEREVKNLTSLREDEKGQWQRMAAEYDEKSRRLRQELDNLGKETSRLRGQTTELTSRVERSLTEYTALKEKLDGGKKDLGPRNGHKEATIRKLNADVAAAETEAKETERETEEYAEDIQETRTHLERHSGWRDGTKNRWDDVKGQREKEQPELEALKDEASRLRERIKAAERTLESRNVRHRELQQRVNDLGETQHQLEKENQELRWQQEEEFPEDRDKEPAPCPTCATNAKVADQVPELRREYEQLEKERAELGEWAMKVKQELEHVKDAVVERREKKMQALFRKQTSSTSEESPVAQLPETPKRRASRRSEKVVVGAKKKQVVQRQSRSMSAASRARRARATAVVPATPRPRSGTRTTISATESRRTSTEVAAAGTRVASSSVVKGASSSVVEGDSSVVTEGGNEEVSVRVNANVNVRVVEAFSENSSATAKEEGYDVGTDGGTE